MPKDNTCMPSMVAKFFPKRSLDIEFTGSGGRNKLMRMERKGISEADRILGAESGGPNRTGAGDSDLVGIIDVALPVSTCCLSYVEFYYLVIHFIFDIRTLSASGAVRCSFLTIRIKKRGTQTYLECIIMYLINN